MKQDWLTIKAASEFLGVAPITIYRLLASGKGPPFLKLSKKLLRIERGMLEGWLADRTAVHGSKHGSVAT